MECPLGDQKRPHKGTYRKMYKRIPGRENHCTSFRNSLQTSATDLS